MPLSPGGEVDPLRHLSKDERNEAKVETGSRNGSGQQREEKDEPPLSSAEEHAAEGGANEERSPAKVWLSPALQPLVPVSLSELRLEKPSSQRQAEQNEEQVASTAAREEALDLRETRGDEAVQGSEAITVNSSDRWDVLAADEAQKRAERKTPGVAVQLPRGMRPTIKVPVLIAHCELHVDVEGHVDTPLPVAEIHGVEWRVRSLACRLLLPGNRLLLRGILQAKVDYAPAGSPGSMRSATVYLPLKQATNVAYRYPPVLPAKKERNEYLFKIDPISDEICVHREQIDPFSDEPLYDLRVLRVISTEHTENAAEAARIWL
ncbi:hypothetical protein BSNK01_14280 [Bacillaceae bacterium]